MAIKLSKSIVKQYVEEVSASLSLSFPEAYEAFLVNCNGMFLDGASYCDIAFPKVDNEEISFQELFAINAKNTNMDLLTNNSYREEIQALESPLIIGADPGGNLFLVNCNNNDETIYYWDRMHIHYDGNAEFPEKDEEGNIYIAFSNFNEFFQTIMDSVNGDKTTQICEF